MESTVRIPSQLQPLTGGKDAIVTSGATVREVLDNLVRDFPDVRERLLADEGVRRFVNVYVKDEDIRFLDGLDTKLHGGEEINIILAVAGGGRT